MCPVCEFFLDRRTPLIAPTTYTVLIADIILRTYLRHVSVQIYHLQEQNMFVLRWF